MPTLQESIDALDVEVQAIEDVVNGPSSGAGSEVALSGGGTQDTLAKMSLQFTPADDYSAAVQALVDAHEIANPTVTAAALQQIGWSLTELEDGGILDEMVDGACLRHGFNVNATPGTPPISIRGTTGVARGAVPTGPDGAVFTADTANTISFDVASQSALTLAGDFRYSEDAVSLSTPFGIATTTGTGDSGLLLVGQAPPNRGKIFTSDSGVSFNSVDIGDLETAVSVHIYNHNDTICSYSTDNAAAPNVKAWVNGIPIIDDSTVGLEQATSNLDRVTIGAQNTTGSTHALPMMGTVASFFVFDRVLTDEENKTLAKALRHLDPRKKNIIITGDSRSCQITSDIARRVDNWPYKYVSNPHLRREARLCNVAKSGWTAVAMRDNWDERTDHLGVNGTSITEAAQLIWTGANDWQVGPDGPSPPPTYTGSTIWGYVKTIMENGRELGMRNILFTDPEGGTTYSATKEANRVAYNALVRTGSQYWDTLFELDAATGTYRDVRLWVDQVHLNDSGNEELSKLLLNGGLGTFPPKVNRVVLNSDLVINNTTTLRSASTIFPAIDPTEEGFDDFGFWVGANETITATAILKVSHLTNPTSLKVGFSGPTGSTILGSGETKNVGGTGRYGYAEDNAVPAAALVILNAPGADSGSIATLQFHIENGATAGWFELQFAQHAADVNDLTIHAGSAIFPNHLK